jgi:4-carboxymuconolactone decarboxylase
MGKSSTGGLDFRSRHLVRISLCGALGDEERLRDALERALGDGVGPGEAREALLQIYLFAGYPRAINALRVLAETTGGKGDGSAGEAGGREAAEEPGVLEEKGLELMRLIYGRSLESLLANMRELHPDLARWIVREGYGKVLSRPGLDVKDRELCVVAVLEALGCDGQLEAHRRGARNAGASPEEIAQAVELAAPRKRNGREGSQDAEGGS